MQIVKIKRSDKEKIYRLGVEEDKVLNRYISQAIYKVRLSKKLFDALFESHFGRNRFFYGVREDGEIVAILSGCLKPAPRGNIGYIDNIFILKKYSRKGYASILRDEFYRWLKSRKIKFCQLNVLVKNPAKAIYDRWGFEIDEYRMTRKL